MGDLRAPLCPPALSRAPLHNRGDERAASGASSIQHHFLRRLDVPMRRRMYTLFFRAPGVLFAPLPSAVLLPVLSFLPSLGKQSRPWTAARGRGSGSGISCGCGGG
jgi:hypothetical protein